MYLVHLHLHPPAAADPLPGGIRDWLRAAASPEDRIEHVAVHAGARPVPVVGVYLIADSLDDAETCAARVCGRALAGRQELVGWRLTCAQVPLVTPVWEDLLVDRAGPGRNRPGTDPASGRPFHPR
ncbi:hypothetical protein [Streptacidiphilus rugosus]|uniref:hypothetical protein n=1 Tax=Streptacidiphilus rugosus TaxID=405783 RepID=UPI00068E9215|nr:hypothetical protein [Streptacidiphilus rugosus]